MITITTNAGAKYPTITGICFDIEAYSGTYDIRTPYLGNNSKIPSKPKVEMKAMLDNDNEVRQLIALWEKNIDYGQGVFMTETEVFSTFGVFGFRQISPLVHRKSNGINTITLTAEVVFNGNTNTNTPPVVNDIDIYVDKNSKDNIVVLRGYDKDGDNMSFEVQVPTAFGALRGSGNNLYYSPDKDMTGVDCFTYVAKDYLSTSNVGVVRIHIDSGLMPKATFSYDMTGAIGVSGNYYYDDGSGNFVRGVGGKITPIGNTIIIKSDNHVVSLSDTVNIKALRVMSWGDRKDFSKLCYGAKTIKNFSIDSTAGDCKGENFNEMFLDSGVDIVQGFNTSKGKTMRAMFRGSDISMLGNFDLSACEDFRYFVADTKLSKAIGVLTTPAGLFFDYMFYNTPLLTCLGGIDTRKKQSTVNMFYNSGLTNPTKAEQTDIESGHLWASTSSCILEIKDITHVGESQTCVISNIGGTCQSKGQYKINLKANAGAGITYTWTSNASIVSGGATDTVTVTTASLGSDVDVWVACTVHDGATNVNSGRYNFKHTRTKDYLVLTLPKSYAEIDLRAFIDANNPQNKTEVEVINNVENCSLRTGDLTGLDVHLVNNGKFIGFPIAVRGNHVEGTRVNQKENGLNLDSALLLTNNGTIAGAGGWGKVGANGATSSRVINISKGNVWGAGGIWYRPCLKAHGDRETWIAFNNGAQVVGRGYAPLSVVVGGETLYRTNAVTANRKEARCSSKEVKTVGYNTFTNKTITVIGGRGGLGGMGAGYNSPAKIGAVGGLSTPSGGYSGARGHTGGQLGHGGNAYLYAGGFSLTGNKFLKQGSTIGTLLGVKK